MKEYRPWGYFEVIVDDPAYKIKRIIVHPGKRFSLQYHTRRDEHWYLVSGTAAITTGKLEKKYQTGDSIDIPRKTPHRFENTGRADALFIEIQTGEYFGEDDIERIEDDYGRT